MDMGISHGIIHLDEFWNTKFCLTSSQWIGDMGNRERTSLGFTKGTTWPVLLRKSLYYFAGLSIYNLKVHKLGKGNH